MFKNGLYPSIFWGFVKGDAVVQWLGINFKEYH